MTVTWSRQIDVFFQGYVSFDIFALIVFMIIWYGFYPSAIRVVGYSDHQRRAGGRAFGRSEIQLLLKI